MTYVPLAAVIVLIATSVWWMRRPFARAQPTVLSHGVPRAVLGATAVIFVVWGAVHTAQTADVVVAHRRVEREGVVVTGEVYDPSGFLEFRTAIRRENVCWVALVRVTLDGKDVDREVFVQPGSVGEGSRFRVKVLPERDERGIAIDHACQRPNDHPASFVALLSLAGVSMALRKVAAA